MNNFKQAVKTIVPTAAWAILKRARVSVASSFFRPYLVHHQYYGSEFEIRIADGVAQGWYDHDWPTMAEFDLLRTGKLQPGARVFDIGAHQSVVALMLSRIVGTQGQVIAIEADRHCVNIGRENCERNQAANLEIVHGAIAAKSGEITFTLDGHVDNPSQKSARVVVPAYSVDDLAERYGMPDVLFIDVEGYECEALRGAAKTLSYKPDCFVEIHVGAGLEDFGGTVPELLEFFPEAHYTLFTAKPDGSAFVPLARGGVAVRERCFLVALGKSSIC
ncbi:MAG: hypothetical protein C5B51_27370 [Terriglobia bacterium]|nr:MAG: hypothetical protein C5B51_27370 [Terriglobia bacterium]